MDKISKTIIASIATFIVIAGLILTIAPKKHALINIQSSTAKAINKNLLKHRKESYPTTDANQLEILRVDVWNYSTF